MEEPRTDFDWSKFEPHLMEEGFPVSGIVSFSSAEKLYQTHANRYQDWIKKGHHGEMGYLSRGLERRLNPRLVFPELESVITVLRPYHPSPVGDETLRYARYLNGPDYHEDLNQKLEKAILRAREQFVLPSDFKYKICVDTSAVLERTWATLCGLGWIGKNTLLIHPQLGSYTFIGVVFTNLKVHAEPKILKDYCGNCERCLRACPTEALSEHVLDSNKCISYLTLEKRGEWKQKFNLSGYLAGCDICQEVCPFNTKPSKGAKSVDVPSSLLLDLTLLENETETEYLKRIEGSALSRIKFQDFKRNLYANLNETHK